MFGINHNLPLPPAMDAEKKYFSTTGAGNIAYYVDRAQTGHPLVLVHSINAAASAFEMKPLFEHYRLQRPVFAPDLPGYGFSDRSVRPYTPELFASVITQFLEQEVGEAADVIALSLGSEFAATVAFERPELMRSLALISPTGLGEIREIGEETSRKIQRAINFPLWGQSLFDLLATRRSINYYLGKNFYGQPAQEMLDYAYVTAHQPGARHAPFYFISGQLFTSDIRERVYEQLESETLILYDRDPNISFDQLPFAEQRNPRLQSQRIAPSCGLPHWELPIETFQALDAFWSQRTRE